MTVDELQKQLDSLKRIHDSTNQALVQAMKELSDVRIQNKLLQDRDRQVTTSQVIANGIIQKTVDNANMLNQKYLEEISLLRNRIRELEGK